MSTRTEGTERAARIGRIVAMQLRAVLAGDAPADEELIASHADLLPELAAELRKVRLVQATYAVVDAPVSGHSLSVRCPHCQCANHVACEGSFTDLTCSSCGSRFSVIDDSEESAQQAPRQLAHFELLQRLGTGSFGVVWKARDTQLDRVVAVKMPRRGQLSQAEAELFLREARAAAQLRHPHIVSVHEVGRERETVYIVSDFIAGATLAESLTAQPFTAREAAALCVKIARALEHAHGAGIVHRDLKPDNIVIDEQGEPHLMDFGLARRAAGEVTLTIDGQLVGTPAYMSPEQAQGDAHCADARSDIYSLGVILFELLTGEVPFRGKAATLAHQVIHNDPPAPRTLNPRVPRDLETITLKCLEKDPVRRYATARAVADDLGRYLRGEPIVARPVGHFERGWRWCRRYPWKAAACALALLVIAAAPVIAWRENARRQMAVAQERATYRRLYFSDMHGAVDALDGGNMALVMDLLNRHQPRPGREDMRSFEWYYLWQQCQRGRSQRTISAGDAVRCVAVSPDGRTLATGVAQLNAEECAVKLWDLSTGECRQVLPLPYVWPNAVAFAPDGKTLACRTARGMVVWDLASGASLLNTTDRIFENSALAFSPDGRFLAGVTEQYKVIQIWDAATLLLSRTIDIPQGGAYVLAFSHQSDSLVSLNKDGNLTFWDPSTGNQLYVLPGKSDYVAPICFAPDGATLVSCGNAGEIVIWDLRLQTPLRTLIGHSKIVNALSFSRDGKRLASASNDGTVKLWDTQRFELKDTLLGNSGRVPSIAFTPNGRMLAAAGMDGVVKLWDLSAEARRDILTGHAVGVWCVAVSPDGARVASGAHDGNVRIWDTATGRETNSLAAHVGEVGCVKFDAAGHTLASSGQDGTIILWDAMSGQTKGRLEGSPGNIRHIVFTPDAKGLVSIARDEIRIWDLDAMELRGKLPAQGSSSALAVSPDGRIAATDTTTGAIDIWDLGSFARVRSLSGHQPVTGTESLAFSPNGKILASASHDKTVKLWDWQSGSELRKFVGHTEYVYCVAFSPVDGRLLASASYDQTVRLWDVETGEERAVLPGHTGEVYWVAFADDGRTLASASEDRTVRLWRAASPAEVQATEKR